MADLCDDPATINAMSAKIREGYDIVVGSRYISGEKGLVDLPGRPFSPILWVTPSIL